MKNKTLQVAVRSHEAAVPQSAGTLESDPLPLLHLRGDGWFLVAVLLSESLRWSHSVA